MIRMIRVRKVIEESAADEVPDHEWAEYNLPFALLPGLPGDDEDQQAFLGLDMEIDAKLPDRAA